MNDQPEGLAALKAGHLMTSPIITLKEDQSLREAAGILLENGIQGAPVTSGDGEVVGVLSVTDLARYEQEREPDVVQESAFYHLRDVARREEIPMTEGFHIESANEPRVRDVMTPSIITVHLDTPLADILSTLLRLRIHRVLVVQPGDKKVVGVVTETDILRALQDHLSRRAQ